MCTTTLKILKVKTLYKFYRVLNLSYNIILQIFQNLNVKEASILHEFKFFLGKHLFLHQGTSRNFCLPFMADVMIFFFSIHFLKLKHYAHIYSITLASCKIRLLNSSGNYFRQKKFPLQRP